MREDILRPNKAFGPEVPKSMVNAKALAFASQCEGAAAWVERMDRLAILVISFHC